MVAYLWIIGLLIVRFYPDLPIGRWCRRTLVDAPLDLARRLERRHLILLLVGAVAMQAFVIAMPMDMAFVATLDVATYLDVLIAVSMLTAVARVRMFADLMQAHARSFAATMPRRRAAPAQDGSEPSMSVPPSEI